jgi:hypothetical protein
MRHSAVPPALARPRAARGPVAGNNSEGPCIHAEGEKGQLGHSGRLKVETDSDPPGGFKYLYVSYGPCDVACSDGVPSAGCLARELSDTRGHLS